MAVRIGIIMAVVAVLLIHMDRNQQGNMMPSNSLHSDSQHHGKVFHSAIMDQKTQLGDRRTAKL